MPTLRSVAWLQPTFFAIRVCLLAVATTFAVPAFSRAAEETIDYPLVVINTASVQRLQENAKFIVEIAEHTEMVDRIDKWMASTLKDLNGIDRTRPFGVMVYMPAGFIGVPIGISYIPITNLDDALQTIAFGQGTVTAVDGKKGYNEIRYGESWKMRTRQIGGYLFLVGPDGDDETLEKNFPDPSKLTSRLSSQYDVAVSLQIKNIPPTTRQLFLEFLKTSAQAELQQRDGEPESSYRLRRANGDSWLEFIDRVITQGEEFTIGGRMDPATHKANIDFEIAGTSDSKLAKYFQDMSGKRTYFGTLLTNPSTLTMSASWLISEKQRPLLTNVFDAAKKDLTKASEKSNIQGVSTKVDPLFKVLSATADAGHVDLIAQLVGTEPGKFALVAGTKLVASRSLPNQVTEMLQFVKDYPDGSELLKKLEIGSAEIDSFPVHRLEINPPDKPGQRMFGETAHLYMYASSQALWFAFGGDAAQGALQEAVAQVALPQDPQQSRNRVPFMFVTHANNWLSVGDDENPRAVAFNKEARESFKEDNDAMQLTVRPTDNGVRIRLEFEEGFIALLGRGITNGDNQGMFNPRRRARQLDEDGQPQQQTPPQRRPRRQGN